MKIIVEFDSLDQFYQYFGPHNPVITPPADEPKKTKVKKSAPQTNLQDSAPEDEKRDAQPMVEETEKDRVLSVFKSVFDKKGQEACKAMLEKFEVKRISEVPVEAYPRFIADCEQELSSN